MKIGAGVLSERGIIALILSRLTKFPSTALPYGDDAATFPISKRQVAVLKADMLMARTDVPRTMTTRQAGRKAMVINVSDFASKGVQPRAAMVSLGLPRNITAREVKQISLGLDDGAREYGAYILGGDTNLSQDLVLSCFLYGTSRLNQIIPRNGAKPGHSIFVSGKFGHQAAGLRLLLGHGKAPRKMRQQIIEPVLKPKARLELGLTLAAGKIASSCIDSSDGLAWSLHELAHFSKVGMRIDRLPTSRLASHFAEINGLDVGNLVLYGGEEYELVFTAPRGKVGRLPSRLRRGLVEIGVVTDDEGRVSLGRGNTVMRKGWDPFAD